MQFQTVKQEKMSWSDFHDQLFVNLTAKQKELFHKKNRDVYDLYKAGRSPQEVVQYLVAGAI